MPSIIESFEEFAQRQGCDHIDGGTTYSIQVGENVTLCYFANGAVSDRHSHWDPPTDPKTLASRNREYLKLKLAKEIQQFTSYKTTVLQQAKNHLANPDNCPPPPPNAAQQLRAGASRIGKLRQELAALEQQLEDPEEARRLQEQRAYQLSAMAQQELLAQEIQSIGI